jgi:hypothetical protein
MRAGSSRAAEERRHFNFQRYVVFDFYRMESVKFSVKESWAEGSFGCSWCGVLFRIDSPGIKRHGIKSSKSRLYAATQS